MIDTITRMLIDQMVSKDIITVDKREQYEYAAISILESTVTILSILVIGIYEKMFLQTACFLYVFLSLRKRTGGYHANSFGKCFVLSILVYLFIIKVIYFYFYMKDTQFVLVILTISSAIIAAIGAVNHPNWNLDYYEYKVIKHSARVRVLIIYLLTTIGIIIGLKKSYMVLMALAVILCAATIVVAKILGQELEKEKWYEEG